MIKLLICNLLIGTLLTVQQTSALPAICYLQKDSGHCRASYPRWFYNSNITEQNCQAFEWSGCGGNDNNFDSMEDCEARCPLETTEALEPPMIMRLASYTDHHEVSIAETTTSRPSPWTLSLPPETRSWSPPSSSVTILPLDHDPDEIKLPDYGIVILVVGVLLILLLAGIIAYFYKRSGWIAKKGDDDQYDVIDKGAPHYEKPFSRGEPYTPAPYTLEPHLGVEPTYQDIYYMVDEKRTPEEYQQFKIEL